VRARWLIVLVTAAALIGVPLVVAARPVPSSVSAPTDLARKIATSAAVGWSGQVSSSGGLQVPDSEGFANLAEVLGDSHALRVWWRDAENWRIDSVRSTGETDLFFNGHVLVRWVFEAQRATIAPTSTVRLPDASDLLPATLGRLLLEGARPEDLTGLPPRRIAGLAAAGLRLQPPPGSSRIERVDMWAEPATGLPLAVEVSAVGDRRPTLTTTVTHIELAQPPVASTQFDPAPSVELVNEEAVDVAAAANAFAPIDLPAAVAGLAARGGQDPGSVGVYGQGPASLIVIPLRRDVARPLRQQLRDSVAARESRLGTEVAAGPVALLLTPRGQAGSLLLAGTVTAETMQRAARELLAS
jgi:hypothetical protein